MARGYGKGRQSVKTVYHSGVAILNRTGKANDWYISDPKHHRVRWGTLQECRDDAEHLIAFGQFPPRKQGWA